MKKIWGLFCVLLGIILISQTSTTVEAAGKFQIKQYHITADVQKNGDVEYTQRLKYHFNGDFHGVYYNQNLKGITSYTKPQVFVDTGYSKIRLQESASGKDNTYKITKTGDTLGIKVYHEIDTGNVTFIYKYRLSGVVVNYLDTAMMNWKVIDDWDNILNNVQVKINLPQRNISNLQAWTHGPLEGNNVVSKKKGQVIATVAEVPANMSVESRLLFPTSVTPDNSHVVKRNIKAKALAQEKKFAEQANASRKRQRIIYYSMIILCLAIIVGIYLYRFISYFKNTNRDHKIPTPLYHSFDAPKFLPSFTKVILERQSQADSQSLTADIMDEVGHRRMKIEQVGKTYEITALVPPTNEFFQYLINDIGDGKKVSLKQIRAEAKNFDSSMSRKFDTWAENAAKGREKYLDQKNMDQVDGFKIAAIATTVIGFMFLIVNMMFYQKILIAGITFVTLTAISWLIYWWINHITAQYTDEGEESVNQIRAFKRMLEDIDDIKLSEVGDIILWEQFIPYAVAFGVADKVVKALRVNFTAKELDQSLIIPYYIGMNNFFSSTSAGFQSSFIGAMGAGGATNISGGSGGFSGGSSGGFGGGSGGAF